MQKGELYRVCLKASNFSQIPTFRIKIGKSQKKINPYFIPSDKQRYNCDSILQRRNQQPNLILSVFYAYKFIGSGSIIFEKPQMPNQKLTIKNRDEEVVGVIDLSLMRIERVVQVPSLDIQIKDLTLDDISPKDITGSPFIVLKYGQLNYQTQKQAVYNSDRQFVLNEKFSFPQSEMERIIVEIWCQYGQTRKFSGVSLIYLRQKDDINREGVFDISYMSKKRGRIRINIFEDKNKQAQKKDYSNAPKRTLKATVIETVLLNPSPKGVYIKISVAKQFFQTTSIFTQTKQISWNQAFTMQVNTQKEELTAQLYMKHQQKQQLLGRAFLQISKVGNRTYEITLLNETQMDIGKVYLQFYDHEIYLKQRKTISKQLAAKIHGDLSLIKNRYQSKQPLHEYMENLHSVLQQGLLAVSKKKTENPLRQLGEFLLAYKK